MDDRVTARMRLHFAQADLKVTELEALEKQTPSLRSNSDQRLRIARRLRVARELAESWQTVLRLAEYELKMGTEEAAGPEKEFKAAPERVVAQVAYVANDRNRVYCNLRPCYSFAPSHTRLVPLTADQMPEGGQCDNCGTDVLA